MAATERSILVYGATGRSGLSVIENALAAGWRVHAFVRNPDKVPAELRERVTIVKGDLCDAAAVSAAVSAARPNAIVDASSALPFGHAKGQPANNADRNIILRATFAALEADGRFDDCVVIIVGGQLIPEPGGTIKDWLPACLAWTLRTLVMPTAWREATATILWLFQDTPPAPFASSCRAWARWWPSRRAACCVRRGRRTTSSEGRPATATWAQRSSGWRATRAGSGSARRSSSTTSE